MDNAMVALISWLLYADELPKRLRRHGCVREQLRRMLQGCKVFSMEMSFQFNPAKCEIIAAYVVNPTECTLYQRPVKRSDIFVYLEIVMGGILPKIHAKALSGYKRQ